MSLRLFQAEQAQPFNVLTMRLLPSGKTTISLMPVHSLPCRCSLHIYLHKHALKPLLTPHGLKAYIEPLGPRPEIMWFI